MLRLYLRLKCFNSTDTHVRMDNPYILSEYNLNKIFIRTTRKFDSNGLYSHLHSQGIISTLD